MNAGNPNISLQLGYIKYEKMTANSCPIMLIELENETMYPLIELGVISDKYIPTIYDAIPMPIPANNLPTIISCSFLA